MSWEGRDTKYSDCGRIDREIMEGLQKSNKKARWTDHHLAQMEFIDNDIAKLHERRRHEREWLEEHCSHPVSHQIVNKYSPEDTLGNFCDYSEYLYKCNICNMRLHKENR